MTADIAITDWEDLLNAVKYRLRLSVSWPVATATDAGPAPQAKPAWVQTSVLECVRALDQLQLTLAHELARQQGLERELDEAKLALARVRAELIADLTR